MNETLDDINQRLGQFMSAYRISVNHLSKVLNVPQPTLRRQLNGEGVISAGNLQAILRNYPDLSADWLILGQGAMIRGEENNMPQDDKATIELLQSALNEEKKRSREYWETIQKLIDK